MDNKAFIVVDLSFGDTGKGTIVDALVRQNKSDLVVRYSGGPQAAHHVTLDDGTVHCFSQFGSGTFSGAKTFLSKRMLVNPLTLEDEANHLINKGIHNPYENLFIDENCIVITPFHRAINKLRELARKNSVHGTCGHGVWEAVKDNLKGEEFSIKIKELNIVFGLKEKLNFIQAWKNLELNEIIHNLAPCPEFDQAYGILNDKNIIDVLISRYRYFYNKINIIKDNGKSLISSSNNPVFEASQGVLLDQNYGFAPYNSATTTTSANAEKLLKSIGFKGKTKKIGITRSYFTRHGAGPFPTEDNTLGLTCDDDNKHNKWQGGFREGWLDFVLLKYAIIANAGIDSLAITHCDKLQLKKTWKVCVDYRHSIEYVPEFIKSCVNPCPEIKSTWLKEVEPVYENKTREEIIRYIEYKLNTKVNILSYGKKFSDKKFIFS